MVVMTMIDDDAVDHGEDGDNDNNVANSRSNTASAIRGPSSRTGKPVGLTITHMYPHARVPSSLRGTTRSRSTQTRWPCSVRQQLSGPKRRSRMLA